MKRSCSKSTPDRAVFSLFRTAIAAIVIISALSHHVLAEDVIRIQKPHSETDKRHVYVNAVLTEALNKTVSEYGDFTITLTLQGLARNRSLQELIAGRNINVHIVPTQEIWEKKTIPIRIPILKGILGYRLFLIKRQNIGKFSMVNSVEDLKKLQAGLRQQWSTAKAMELQGFNIVYGNHYEGLFKMLDGNRFDYFPRGINEIFFELDNRIEEFPDLTIEPTKALYLPLPYYVFVSPEYPRLAERIQNGLLLMIGDGSFDKLFLSHNDSFIKKANLAKRQIFYVDNTLLSPETPFNQKNLWFDPLHN